MKNSVFISTFLWVLLVSPVAFSQQPRFPDCTGMFTMELHIKSADVSGLILITVDSMQSERIIMMAETGPKLLDMSISRDGYDIHYVYPKLNKKVIMRTLAEDFSLLSGVPCKYLTPDETLYGSNNEYIFRLSNKKNVHYYADTLNNQLKEGYLRVKNKVKSRFYFHFNQDNTGIESMLLQHSGFDMSLRLQKVKGEM